MPGQERRTTPSVSPIPRQRPADLGQQPLAPELPPDFAQQGTTPGMYEGLGMSDDTGEFGDLGARKRNGDPTGVILHQTMSTSGESTEQAYQQRIRNGKHVGAHYLIDENGDTSLTVPTDEVVYHAQGHNSSGIGIETVGMPEQVSQRGNMHAQIEAIDLSPQLKARLLAMSERELKQTMSSNGNYIYKDITGPQKRANWNLLRAIASEHGIELEADVDSHEHVQAKTIGEGENIEEFVDAMLHWPGRIDHLEERIGRVRELGGHDALADELSAILAQNKADHAAVAADKSMAENNALEGEALLGDGGPATDREARREQFWDEFYPRMEALDSAIERSYVGEDANLA